MSQIIHDMVGRQIREIYPRTPQAIEEPVLEILNLRGSPKPRHVNLTLRAGEIFGVAGLIGAGRTEMVRVCFGLDRLTDGQVVVMGRETTRADPSRRLREGIGLVSENRKEEGLLLQRSIADNLTLTRLRPFSRCGLLSAARQQTAAHNWIERLRIRAANPTQCVNELSGGNQQKVAVARLLHHNAKILLLDEPTRGIDVGSKAQIYEWIGELAAEGRSILFISSYVPELLGICDTIGVRHRGVMTEVRPAAQWDEHSIVTAAVGQREATAA
jgi:ribose transport system ATP-binding protein